MYSSLSSHKKAWSSSPQNHCIQVRGASSLKSDYSDMEDSNLLNMYLNMGVNKWMDFVFMF